MLGLIGNSNLIMLLRRRNACAKASANAQRLPVWFSVVPPRRCEIIFFHTLKIYWPME
jgi:hypothetical protein